MINIARGITRSRYCGYQNALKKPRAVLWLALLCFDVDSGSGSWLGRRACFLPSSANLQAALPPNINSHLRQQHPFPPPNHVHTTTLSPLPHVAPSSVCVCRHDHPSLHAQTLLPAVNGLVLKRVPVARVCPASRRFPSANPSHGSSTHSQPSGPRQHGLSKGSSGHCAQRRKLAFPRLAAPRRKAHASSAGRKCIWTTADQEANP